MKKILMALVMVGMAYCSAQAQEVKRVCRKTTKGDVSCYKTKYAQNFPVCKDSRGYFICGQTRTYKNSTRSTESMTVSAENPMTFYGFYEPEQVAETPSQDMTPQSQSYPQYEENATVPYGAPYHEPKKGFKYCYFGDNVAELNRNPYKACPAPASDGPEAAKTRAWIHGN